MPTLKRDVSKAEDRAPFGTYDGAWPPNGNYPSVIRSIRLKHGKDSGKPYLNVLSVVDAPEDSAKAEFNGFPTWTMVSLAGDEVNEMREKGLYLAIAGKPAVSIVTDNATPDPNVTKIGGKDPAGARCRVDISDKDSQDGKPRGTWIYPDNSTTQKIAELRDDDADDNDDDDDGGDETVEAEEKVTPIRGRRTAKKSASAPSPAVEDESDEDPGSMTLPNLRRYAKSKGIDVAGLSKPQILKAIEDLSEDGDEDESEDESEYETSENPQTIRAMPIGQLRKFLKGVGFDLDDFKENGKTNIDDVVEVLAEENIISPF